MQIDYQKIDPTSIDKKELERELYWNLKTYDQYFIRERIKKYEEKQKEREPIKAENKSLFDNVQKFFE